MAKADIDFEKELWDAANELRGALSENNLHPILIYAQLMATDESRKIETAEIILNEHIRPNL